MDRIMSKLFDQGLHDRTFFTIHLKDGTVRCEKEHNWSDFSEMRIVEYFGSKKTVAVSTLPILKIEMYHEGMHEEIDVPENCEVYQAIRSETFIVQESKSQILGRIIGIIKDGQVIEERYLDGTDGIVKGMKL